MNKIIKSHIALGLFVCLVSVSAISCTKEGQEKVNIENVNPNPKIITYLSITLGVTPNEITFDKEKNAFIIRGQAHDAKMIAEMYETANEYKAKYEN